MTCDSARVATKGSSPFISARAELLWPEARDRIANSAWVTRESVGRGQVILFAHAPAFRAAKLGAMRVLENALILGPGLGANQPVELP